MRTLRRTLAAVAVGAALIALGLAHTAGASAPKLVISSPLTGEPVTGKFPVRAHLVLPKGEPDGQIRSVRFYVNGVLIQTDTKPPFALDRGRSFDTGPLEGGPRAVTVKATISFVSATPEEPQEESLERTVTANVFRPPGPGSRLNSAPWREIFNDDFRGDRLSVARWRTQRSDWIKGPIPYSNLEGAGYRAENVSVRGGNLRLSLSERDAAGFPISTASVNTNRRFSFRYGYIEAKLLIPPCSGCWPAFWLLPSADKWPPEIDVVEFFNTAKYKVPWASLHWPARGPSRQEYRHAPVNSDHLGEYVGDWHTFGALWTPHQVRFYLDGRPGPLYDRPSWIPDERMYPIIQLAVQKGHRPRAGSTMLVDHVRAWRY